VDFKNTIIIMTSNLGSEYLLNGERDKAYVILKSISSANVNFSHLWIRISTTVTSVNVTCDDAKRQT